MTTSRRGGALPGLNKGCQTEPIRNTPYKSLKRYDNQVSAPAVPKASESCIIEDWNDTTISGEESYWGQDKPYQE
jgi:hypothetical protein